MKILLSSQEFGFGPTTQLFALCRQWLIHDVPSAKFFVVRNRTTEIFYTQMLTDEPQIQTAIHLVDRYDNCYDVYIGVYDPDIVMYAHTQKKPSLFWCNLGFLRDQDNCHRIFSQYEGGKPINTIPLSTHHDRMILAYACATAVIIRAIDTPTGILREKINHKTIQTGPILFPHIHPKGEATHTLIQCGGQRNPLTNDAIHDAYFDCVARITNDCVNPLVIVHPDLLSLACHHRPQKQILTTVSQYQYQKILAHTDVLYSPFGINTLYETVVYNIPTYILPEQHIGHTKSILAYCGSDSEALKKQAWLLLDSVGYDPDEQYDEALWIQKFGVRYSAMPSTYIDQKKESGKNPTNMIIHYGHHRQINAGLDEIVSWILKQHTS